MTQKQLSGQRSVKCVVWSLQMETTYKGVVGWVQLRTVCYIYFQESSSGESSFQVQLSKDLL